MLISGADDMRRGGEAEGQAQHAAIEFAGRAADDLDMPAGLVLVVHQRG